MDLKRESSSKCYGGAVLKFSHSSRVLKCRMNFNVYLPSEETAPRDLSLPSVIFLSGLTCTEDNFIQKSGAPKVASELGLVLICPDTSPRGVDIEGDNDSWAFGKGAGYYVDATLDPWKENYQMYSYVTEELLQVASSALAQERVTLDVQRKSIMGHSMGGHGALVIGIRNKSEYKSISAFAPIANLSKCDWGKNALEKFLGPEEGGSWSNYDATALVSNLVKQTPDGKAGLLPIKIDQGSADSFYLQGQLRPEAFVNAVGSGDGRVSLDYHLREGYDHSYFFVSTFIADHLKFHSTHLRETR